uniref:Nucleolar protein 11-like protein n=1 Tax=Magallana gigas TaxID=29159 RepID=K1QFP3_MAGGI
MAASIGEPVVFADDIKDPSVLNVATCGTEGSVIVTQNPNLINIYKVEDQKALQSWSTKHNEHITSPVIWSEHNQKYVTVINTKAKCAINRILPSDTTEPVVLFNNGGVAFLGRIKDTQEGPLSDKDEILFCDLMRMSSDLCVVCLLNQEGKLQLMSYWYRNDEWIRHTHPVEVAPNTQVVSCHAVPGRNNVEVFILCLNGDLLCQNLSFDQCTSQILQTIVGVTKTTSMVALSSTHIVLAGCTKDNQDVIGIYDVKFGAFEVCKPLPAAKKSSIKLFALHGHLFVLCHRTLHMFSYSCHPSSLSSILGHQRVDVQPQTETPPPGPLSWSKSKTSSSNTEANKLYSELQNISMAKTQKEFEKKFLSIMKSHESDATGLLSETTTMEQIVQRCVTDQKFWPHNVLDQLLVHRLVPNSVEDAKVAEAAKMDGFSGTGKSNSPLSEAKSHIVNKIVKKPYNDVFIIECLHTITFQNVLTLLEYLCYLISNLDTQVSSMPDLAQIVSFICVLIDAHYQQLVLSPDSQEVLISLHRTVEGQREYFAEFLTLDVLISQMKRQFAIPRPRAVGKYCIEVLHVY